MVGVTRITGVLALVLQLYELAPLAVKLTVFPEQIWVLLLLTAAVEAAYQRTGRP